MPMWYRFSNSRVWVGLAATVMALCVSGCGTGDFVPPPPPELRGNAGGGSTSVATGSATVNSDVLGSAAAGVKSVEVILNGDVDPEELSVQRAAVMLQAGYDRARVRNPRTWRKNGERGKDGDHTHESGRTGP